MICMAGNASDHQLRKTELLPLLNQLHIAKYGK